MRVFRVVTQPGPSTQLAPLPSLPPPLTRAFWLPTLPQTHEHFQGSLFDLLGEAGLELMMEVIDKASALAAVDARDVLAIADAHSGMGPGGRGGGEGGGFPGGMEGFGGAGEPEASAR